MSARPPPAAVASVPAVGVRRRAAACVQSDRGPRVPPGRRGARPRRGGEAPDAWAPPADARLGRQSPGGRSSVGRAPGCGPGGRGFESRRSPLKRLQRAFALCRCITGGVNAGVKSRARLGGRALYRMLAVRAVAAPDRGPWVPGPPGAEPGGRPSGSWPSCTHPRDEASAIRLRIRGFRPDRGRLPEGTRRVAEPNPGVGRPPGPDVVWTPRHVQACTGLLAPGTRPLRPPRACSRFELAALPAVSPGAVVPAVEAGASLRRLETLAGRPGRTSPRSSRSARPCATARCVLAAAEGDAGASERGAGRRPGSCQRRMGRRRTRPPPTSAKPGGRRRARVRRPPRRVAG